MNEHVVLKVVVKLLLPLIVLYALYIQLGGKTSPGGGFQSGVILAAGFIAYSFASGLGELQQIVKPVIVRALAAIGALIYAGAGVLSMVMGGRFLDYSVFFADKIAAQKFGVMLIEGGVGITVFAVIMIIFYAFAQRSEDA